MAFLIRLLLFAVPALIILLFVKEYRKQKALADKSWEDQWEQKKDNFKLDQELKAKEREIEKLKDRLDETNDT